MGFNYWGICFFVIPIVAALLLVSIEELKNKLKVRSVTKCQKYHF